VHNIFAKNYNLKYFALKQQFLEADCIKNL